MLSRVYKYVLVLVLAFPGAVSASTQVREVWKAKWSGGKCTLVLRYSLETLQGSAKPRGSCGDFLRNAKSFVYTDDTRSEMILFSRKGAKGPILGAFDKTGKNSMQGEIADGVSASLFKSSSSSTSTSSSVSTNGSIESLLGAVLGLDGDNADTNCVRYADTRTCAISQDKKDPKIPTFDTIKMQVLSDQKIYPFSGGKGFPYDERLTEGSSRAFKACEKPFNSNESWCQVVRSDGFFTGWVKRQDEDWVYLRRGS